MTERLRVSPFGALSMAVAISAFALGCGTVAEARGMPEWCLPEAFANCAANVTRLAGSRVAMGPTQSGWRTLVAGVLQQRLAMQPGCMKNIWVSLLASCAAVADLTAALAHEVTSSVPYPRASTSFTWSFTHACTSLG